MKISKLSIVIPVYNEKGTIQELLKRVEKARIGRIKKEIIVIDDGSTDGTTSILKKLEKTGKYRIFYHQKNQGKGAALKTGFLKTTGDVVIVQDADLEYDPKEYSKILGPFLRNNADVVYGSRFMGEAPHRVLYFWHYLGNKILTTLSNIFTNLNLTDMETCYKAFRGNLIRKIAPKLKSKRFGFEPEITARISKVKDIKIYEVGISYRGRTYKEGKKINWRDGVRAIWEITKYNLLIKKKLNHNILVCALCSIYFLTALLKIQFPGIQYDEILFGNAALGGIDNSFIAARLFSIPIFLMPYIGALKSYIYFPIFKILGVSAYTIRIPIIALSTMALFFLYKLLLISANRFIATLTIILLISDPSFIAHTRLDVGPSALSFFFRVLALLFFYQLLKERKNKHLILFLSSLCLGLFNKMDYLWFINSLLFSVIIFHREIFRQISFKKLLSSKSSYYIVILIALFSGIMAFMLKNINLFQEINPFQIYSRFGIALNSLIGLINGHIFFNYMIGNLNPITAQYYGRTFFSLIGISVFLAAIKRPLPTSYFFYLVIACTTFFQIIVTNRATAPWHVFELYPFLTILISYSIYFIYLLPVRKFSPLLKKLLVVTIISIIVFYQFSTYRQYVIHYDKPLKNIYWSNKIYDLIYFAKTRKENFVSIDWGIHNQLITFNQERGKYYELCYFLNEDLSQKQKQWIHDEFLTPEQAYIFILHPDDEAVFKTARSNLFLIADLYKIKMKKIKEFTENGKIIYELYISSENSKLGL